MKRFGEKSCFARLGGNERHVIFFQRTSYGNALGAFYRKLPMGRKDTGFGGKLTHILVIRCELKYTDIFVGRQIY